MFLAVIAVENDQPLIINGFDADFRLRVFMLAQLFLLLFASEK